MTRAAEQLARRADRAWHADPSARRGSRRRAAGPSFPRGGADQSRQLPARAGARNPEAGRGDSEQVIRACERENSEAIRLGITPALTLVCGTEIALAVREQLPQVFLSIVEAMSHVLIDTLSRGETDFILCYDVPDLPQLSRTALLQDDLDARSHCPDRARESRSHSSMRSKRPSRCRRKAISVRTAVKRTARDLGLELKVAYEVRSISAMKNLVMRGAASSVLPYFAAIDELRAGKLDARPIIDAGDQADLVPRIVETERPVQERSGPHGCGEDIARPA